MSFVPRWLNHFFGWWWLVHVLKLFNAWHGLVDAFVLRLEVAYGWVVPYRPIVTRSVWLIEIIRIVIVVKKRRRVHERPVG